MNNVVMNYSAESAARAGGGEYVSEGGAYVVSITEAKFVTAKTGSSGIEFSVVTQDGLKANYLSVYYAKGNGEAITGGQSMLNAMMGILGVRQITNIKKPDNLFHCPEFEGKTIGLFLQKKLTTKSNGDDSYGFEIKVPFDPTDRKTMREKLDSKPAQTIDRMIASYKDHDERRPVGNSSVGSFANEYAGYPEFN